jgi:hypothetical protein
MSVAQSRFLTLRLVVSVCGDGRSGLEKLPIAGPVWISSTPARGPELTPGHLPMSLCDKLDLEISEVELLILFSTLLHASVTYECWLGQVSGQVPAKGQQRGMRLR